MFYFSFCFICCHIFLFFIPFSHLSPYFLTFFLYNFHLYLFFDYSVIFYYLIFLFFFHLHPFHPRHMIFFLRLFYFLISRWLCYFQWLFSLSSCNIFNFLCLWSVGVKDFAPYSIRCVIFLILYSYLQYVSVYVSVCLPLPATLWLKKEGLDMR